MNIDFISVCVHPLQKATEMMILNALSLLYT